MDASTLYPNSPQDSKASLSDIVNRANVGESQRARNEAMREAQALSPEDFQYKFNKQIQEANNPEELWAGNKLGANQNPDQEIKDFAGKALTNYRGNLYYYGNTDYTTDAGIQSLFAQGGYKPTAGAIDDELKNAGFKLPTFRNQAYYKGDDPTTQQGLESLMTKGGWSNYGAGNDRFKYSFLDPNSAGKFGLLKGNYYGKGYDPYSIQLGTGGYTQRARPDGYSYDILNSTGEVLGQGYYNIDTSVSNILNNKKAGAIQEKQLANYKQVYNAPEQSGETNVFGQGSWGWEANPWYTPSGSANARELMASGKDPAEIFKLLNGGPDYNSTSTRYNWIGNDINFPGGYGSRAEAEQAWLDKQLGIYGKANTESEKLEFYAQLLDPNNTLGLSNAHGGDSRTLQAMQDYANKPINIWNSPATELYSDFSPDQYAKFLDPKITSVGDLKSNSLTGQQSMVGSEPIVANGKIIGYRNPNTYDPTQATYDIHEAYKEGPAIDRSTHSFNAVGNSGNFVTPNNPKWYAQNVYKDPMGGGTVMRADAVANNPGLSTNDYYNVGINDYLKKGGFTSTVGPMATKALLNYIAPGSASLMEGATTGDWKNAGIGAALSFAGSDYGLGQYAGDVGSALGATGDLATTVGRGVIGAGLGATGAALHGQGLSNVLRAAATGGLAPAVARELSSLFGGYIGDLTGNTDIGSTVGRVVSPVLNQGLKNLLSNNKFGTNMGQAVIQGGLSGIGGLLNPQDQRRNQVQKQTNTRKA